jgi:hypothetical protein
MLLLCCSFAVDAHEVAALIVLYCIRATSSALADMTSTAAGSIWVRLLAPVIAASNSPAASSSTDADGSQQQQQHADDVAAPVATGGYDTTGNDNLCLLVKAVTLQYDCLQQVMQCLQLSSEEADGGSAAGNSTADAASSSSSGVLQPNMAHAVLLHIVEVEMGTIPDAQGAPSGKQLDGAAQQQQQQEQQHEQQQVLGWLACLVGLVRQLASQVSSSNSTDYDSVAVHVLEATLQVSAAGGPDLLRATITRTLFCWLLIFAEGWR